MPGRVESVGLTRLRRNRVVALVVFGAGVAAPADAQTDYYNTSAGRPLRIEDAQSIEFRAIEFDVAPLRLERAGAGSYRWSVHPEVEVGVWPRTQLQLGLPFAYVDAPARRDGGRCAMLQMVAHQLAPNRPQRFVHRRDLRHDVGTVAIVVDHLLESADLALDAPQPAHVPRLDVGIDRDGVTSA